MDSLFYLFIFFIFVIKQDRNNKRCCSHGDKNTGANNYNVNTGKSTHTHIASLKAVGVFRLNNLPHTCCK